MDTTLTNFIDALRNADVRISPAETLDAMRALQLVGYCDRTLLKDALAWCCRRPSRRKLPSTHASIDSSLARCAPRVAAAQATASTPADDPGNSPGTRLPSAGGEASDGSTSDGAGEAGEASGESTLEATSVLGRMLMHAAPAEIRVAISVAA